MTTLDDELCAAVAAMEGEVVALVQALVREPSLPGQEAAAQAVVAEALHDLGLDVDVLPCRSEDLRGHPAYTDDGVRPDRADVIGRWRGTGGGRSLVLNGHIDVVPEGDLDRWSRSPWSGAVVDGAVHGRGSADMKAGLAAAVFGLAAAKRVGVRPRGDVILQSVVGEETGGIGTLAAIEHGFTGDAALILEPTRLQACPSHSGALTFRLSVPGLAAHGASKLDGVSALDELRLLLDALDRLEAEREAARVAPISIGTVHGGVWPSSVPEEVVVEGRYGVLPGEPVAAARRAFEDAIASAASTDRWLVDHPPQLAWVEGQFESGATPPDDPFVHAVTTAHRTVTGVDPQVRSVPYGSDLRLFTNHAGMPAVLYGPGDARLAHSVDEHVPIDEVVTAAQSVAVLIARWCG